MERARRNTTVEAAAKLQTDLEDRAERSLSAPPSKSGRKKGSLDSKARKNRCADNNYTYANVKPLNAKRKLGKLDESQSQDTASPLEQLTVLHDATSYYEKSVFDSYVTGQQKNVE